MILSGIIDDSQPGGIIYSGGQWSHQSQNSNYNRTITTCQIVGQGTKSTTPLPSFGCTFFGTDVRIYGGPIANSISFNYSIDGEAFKPAIINFNAVGKTGANIWGLEALSPSLHDLRIIPTAGLFSLDYITYIPATSAPTTSLNVILDDADSSIQYLGSWSKIAPTIPSGVSYQGTVTGSSTTGDTMKVTFIGSSVSVYGLLNQSPGKLSASFSVDGGQSSTFSPFDGSQNSNTSSWSLSQQFYHKDLSPGTHSLSINVTQVSGSQTLWIDSIVFGATSNTLTTQPNENNSNSSSTFSSAKIGGIVVAALFVCSFLLGVYRRLQRRQSNLTGNNHSNSPPFTVPPPTQQPPRPSPQLLNNMQRLNQENALALSGRPGTFMPMPQPPMPGSFPPTIPPTPPPLQYQYSQVPNHVAYPNTFAGIPSSPPVQRVILTPEHSFQQSYAEVPTQSQESRPLTSAQLIPQSQQDGSDGVQHFSPDPATVVNSPFHNLQQTHPDGAEHLSTERGSNLITLTYQDPSRAELSQGSQRATHPVPNDDVEDSDNPPPYNPYPE